MSACRSQLLSYPTGTSLRPGQDCLKQAAVTHGLGSLPRGSNLPLPSNRENPPSMASARAKAPGWVAARDRTYLKPTRDLWLGVHPSKGGYPVSGTCD